jgi:hypothetical protein
MASGQGQRDTSIDPGLGSWIAAQDVPHSAALLHR